MNCGKRASFRKLNGPAKRGSVARHKVGGQRWYHAKSRYGLTREQIEQMFRDQDGRCAICDTALLGRGLERTSPQIDHCHATGKPRALLCRLCNTALGNFRDDPELIGRALAYVNRWAATE